MTPRLAAEAGGWPPALSPLLTAVILFLPPAPRQLHLQDAVWACPVRLASSHRFRGTILAPRRNHHAWKGCVPHDHCRGGHRDQRERRLCGTFDASICGKA